MMENISQLLTLNFFIRYILLIKPLKNNKNKKINFKIKLHLIFSYVAIFAKYWFISTWFKRNLALFVTFSASCIVHFSITSEIVSSATKASSTTTTTEA